MGIVVKFRPTFPGIVIRFVFPIRLVHASTLPRFNPVHTEGVDIYFFVSFFERYLENASDCCVIFKLDFRRTHHLHSEFSREARDVISVRFPSWDPPPENFGRCASWPIRGALITLLATCPQICAYNEYDAFCTAKSDVHAPLTNMIPGVGSL